MTQHVLLVTPLFEICVFLFGLLIGSFLNVVILRLPNQLQHEWRCQCEDFLELPKNELTPPPSFVSSRSRCPDCGHKITALENIPLMSYLFLRGKCSSCDKKISIRYPTIEFITGALFLVVAMKFGPSPQTCFGLTLTAILITLAAIDIDHQLLPDNLTIPLVWAGLLLSVFGTFTNPVDSIIGAATGYLVLWLVFHAFRILTGKEGMGYGDFKLMAALGAWFGWQALPITIAISSVFGAAIGLLLMLFSRLRKDQPISFGPFIACAGWIYFLFGDVITDAYLDFSGI